MKFLKKINIIIRNTFAGKIIKYIPVLFLLINSSFSAQNFWEKLMEPSSGHALSITVNSEDKIFTSVRGEKICISSDNGETWYSKPYEVPLIDYIGILLAMPGDSLIAVSGNDIYIIDSNVENWRKINHNYDSVFQFGINCVVINSKKDIFVGTYLGGVFRLMNNEETWSDISSDLFDKNIIRITIDSNDDIYAESDSGMFISTNNGDSWTKLNNFPSLNLAIAPNGDYFVGDEGDDVNISYNKGTSWIISPIPCTHITSFFFNSEGDAFACTDSGIYKSTDRGFSWIRKNNSRFSVSDRNNFASDSKGDIFCISDNGVYRSTDNGETWVLKNKGIITNHINFLAVNSKGDVFSGTDASIMRSTNKGHDWEKSLQAYNAGPIVINSKDHVFSSQFLAGLFHSSDNGITWKNIDHNMITGFVLTIGPDDKLYHCSRRQLVSSTDNGDTWEVIGNDSLFRSMTIVVNSKGDIFLGTTRGEIYRTTDNGKNWVQVYKAAEEFWFYSFAINSKGDIFAGSQGQGIFRSTDNGENWTQIKDGFTNITFHSLVIDKSDKIFAGTSEGIFLSLDNGDNWTAVNSGLEDMDVRCLTLSPDGYLYAGTFREGVFKSLQPFTDVSKTDNKLPVDYNLEQNYPNPFNPVTVIRYTVGTRHGVFVQLKVYDVLGREVAVLVNEEKTPGFYEITFDADKYNLSSGIYFYTIKAGEFSSTKKFILMK